MSDRGGGPRQSVKTVIDRAHINYKLSSLAQWCIYCEGYHHFMGRLSPTSGLFPEVTPIPGTYDLSPFF